ncbi:MAG: hypothetical protein PSY14_04310 [bacterium]|nr:hypothetical protein [bacterium]
MNDDAPHNHYAARFTQQVISDSVNQQANERIYGRSTWGTGRSRFYIPGWAGFGGLLGAALGAIAAHDRGMSSMEGAISGGIAGFVSLLVLSFVLGFFFKGLSLGWTGVKTVLGTVTGLGGIWASSGILGGVPRATARGGAIGGALGTALALWLNEPVDEAALRVASCGAALGAGWRLIRITMGVLRRGEGSR